MAQLPNPDDYFGSLGAPRLGLSSRDPAMRDVAPPAEPEVEQPAQSAPEMAINSKGHASVPASTQTARDAERVRILNDELASAQQRAAAGDQRAQGDIESLQREIARAGGKAAPAGASPGKSPESKSGSMPNPDDFFGAIPTPQPPKPEKPGLLARAGAAIKDAASGLASAKVDGSSASLGPDRSRPQSLSQHLAENARAVTAESALKPGQMPLPEGVEPSTGRRMGAKAGEAAAYERSLQPYRSRQEAIDDAVDLLESGADPKRVYDSFLKSPMVITSTEIDARGLELGGPHFSMGRTGTVRPGAMEGQVRRVDRGEMPGDQRLLEPMLDALKRAKEQVGLSTDVVSNESIGLSLDALKRAKEKLGLSTDLGKADLWLKEGLSNRIVQRTRAIDAAAPTLENIEGQRAIQMAGKQGLLDAMRAMRDNPLSTLTMLVDSTLQSLPISAAAGGLGFAAGGPIGGAAGAYVGSGAQEYAAAILEAVREHAGNPNNPADVLAALQNPEVMAAARKKGLIRGLTVGAFDAMSAGLAGRFVGPVIKAIEGGVLAGGAAKKAAAVATGKEVGMQAGLGAGGEFAGQKATGEPTNWADILMEAMAEIPGGIPEAAGNIMHERGKAPRPTEQKAAIHSRLDDFAVQTGMPENAVSAIKKASDGVPLSELPGRIKRAIVALRQRGLFKGPVDEQTLSVLDEPPTDVSNPAAEMNTSAGRVDASNTPENPAGISGSPADEDYTGLAGPKESDLTTIDGHPYGTKSGATARANKVGGDVIPVPGGFVVRPKEQDGPDAAGDGGSQPADAGRGAGAELVPDQRPADVLAGPAEPARQGVDVAGADGDGRDGRADALNAGAAPAGDFIPAPNGYKVRITQHSRGSNVLDPTADAGAFIYELRKGDDDPNPLTMVVNKGGKLVTAKTTFGADNASNGTAWVPPNQSAADAVRALLEKRAATPAGSAERKAIDAAIEAAVKPTAPTEVTPTRRVIGKYGRTHNAATEVELRPNADGTLTPFDGKHAMVDFESGDPIVMPADVTDAQAADAIRSAGAITAKDKFFGVKPDAKPAQQDRPASGPVQPAADSQARADLDAALGDLGSILGASNAETSPLAEGTGASHEGQGQGEGRRRETRLLNDRAQAPSTAPASSRQSTHVRPLDDARLTDPTWRAELEASKSDIGWQERGGRLIRDPRTAIDPNSPDAHREGDVVGRTQWLGSDIWRTRPTEGGRINETQAREAIDKALAGEPLTTAQRRYVAHVLDFTQGQLDERERKVYEALEDAMIEAQDRADEDAIELFWASLARIEAQDETDAKQDAAEVDAEDARRNRGAEETPARVAPQGDGRVPQEVRAAQADEGLTLEAQTEQDLRDKAAREEAAAQAERNRQAELAARDAKAKRERDKAEKDARAAQVIAEREAEKKREIDAAAESFELGQEPPKPVDRKVSTEQARGQRDVFDAPSEPAKPAPTPLTDEQAYADNFARFEGKTLAMTFTVADTGQTATLKPDAAKTMRAQQARLDALKALRTCLGA